MKKALIKSWNAGQVAARLIIALGSFAFCLQSAKCADSLAIARIIDCQMPISVRSGKMPLVTVGAELHKNDTVMVSQGGSVTLVFQDGSVRKYAGSAVITFSTGDKPKDGLMIRIASELANIIFPNKTASENARLAVRGSGADQTPSLTIPVLSFPPDGTSLLNAPDRLEWLEIEGGDHYTVSLYGQDRKIWQERTTSVGISFPCDTLPLRPGETYVWMIQAGIGNALLRSEQSFFTLVDTISRSQITHALEEIDRSGFEPRLAALLKLNLYQNHNLLVEEFREVDSLLKRTPYDYVALVAKAKLCESMRLYKEAASCYRQALQQ